MSRFVSALPAGSSPKLTVLPEEVLAARSLNLRLSPTAISLLSIGIWRYIMSAVFIAVGTGLYTIAVPKIVSVEPSHL